MSLQDPVADMLTQLRNAQAVEKKQVKISYSNLKAAIVKLLKEEGYITDYEKIEFDHKPALLITLKYHLGQPVMSMIKRVSRPGLRQYKRKNELPKVQNGLGIAVISTPKGLMTDKAARLAGHGGEVLCYVY
ncbi:MAG: 30S ribosomal protein S8 [Gammaproteobacteria bacterium]